MNDQDGFHLLNPGLDYIVNVGEQNHIRSNNQPNAVEDSMYLEDFMKHQNDRTCAFVQGGCDFWTTIENSEILKLKVIMKQFKLQNCENM